MDSNYGRNLHFMSYGGTLQIMNNGAPSVLLVVLIEHNFLHFAYCLIAYS